MFRGTPGVSEHKVVQTYWAESIASRCEPSGYSKDTILWQKGFGSQSRLVYINPSVVKDTLSECVLLQTLARCQDVIDLCKETRLFSKSNQED